MSTDRSQSQLNLRDFRMQKKTMLSHHSNNDSESRSCKLLLNSIETIYLSSFVTGTFLISVILAQNGAPVRRRIIPVSDSDSDNDCVYVEGRKLTANGVGSVAISQSSSSTKQSESKDTMKNLSVTEKENQMKFLIASFPNVDTMVCQTKTNYALRSFLRLNVRVELPQI